MRIITATLSIFIISLITPIFIGCNSPKKLTKENERYELSYERTTCYGTCPQFKLVIYNSGLLTYEGKMFTEKIGIWQKQISQKELNDIYKKFEKANLKYYQNDYRSEYTDLPSKIITFKNGTFLKTIRIEGKHPELLDELTDYLDSIANSSDWVNQNLN
jgi:uncharacterized membrane protein YvbJ